MSTPVQRGREAVGVALAPHLAVGDDVQPGALLVGDRQPRRVVLRLLEVRRVDAPELMGAHPRREAVAQPLAVDQPVRLRVGADEARGDHRATLTPPQRGARRGVPGHAVHGAAGEVAALPRNRPRSGVRTATRRGSGGRSPGAAGSRRRRRRRPRGSRCGPPGRPGRARGARGCGRGSRGRSARPAPRRGRPCGPARRPSRRRGAARACRPRRCACPPVEAGPLTRQASRAQRRRRRRWFRPTAG